MGKNYAKIPIATAKIKEKNNLYSGNNKNNSEVQRNTSELTLIFT